MKNKKFINCILILTLVTFVSGCTEKQNNKASVTVKPTLATKTQPQIKTTEAPASSLPQKSTATTTVPSSSPSVLLNSAFDADYKKAYDLHNERKYIESIKVCDKILSQEPNHYKALTVKGIAQCFAGSFEKGMLSIEKALEIKPDFGYALYNKALAYELYGQLDRALIWYDKALNVEKYVWTYYGIASIYGRRGDVANTCKYLKSAIQLDNVVKKLAPQEEDFRLVKNSPEFLALVR